MASAVFRLSWELCIPMWPVYQKAFKASSLGVFGSVDIFVCIFLGLSKHQALTLPYVMH